jgi:TolA-binding protein
MSEAIAKATADHEQRMRQLQDQVDTMERQTQEIMDKNREEEVRLRKEKGRNEATLNAKIAQYDEDMAARHKTLDELQKTFKEESDEYAALKEYFDKIDWDLNRGAEELNLLRAVARRREFGERILFNAAATIQKIVRGRIQRALFEKMKSKKKKGKKGKKGKK